MTKEKESEEFFAQVAEHYDAGWRMVYFESHTAGGRNKQLRVACFEKPTGERIESLMPPPPAPPVMCPPQEPCSAPPPSMRSTPPE
jgi:hypothetical protein